MRILVICLLKYQSRLISTAFNFVKDLQIAEDLVQDSFIKSFKSIGSFREDSTFYTWIYRITVNTSKNYLVSKKRKDELLQTDISKEENYVIEPIDKDTPEDFFYANQLHKIIIESLNGLGEDTKTALTLREFDGLSYEQIAEVVNCPVGTVRSRIFRGREIIDDAIKEFRNGHQPSHAEINS